MYEAATLISPTRHATSADRGALPILSSIVVEASLTIVDGFMERIWAGGRTINEEQLVSPSTPFAAIRRQTLSPFSGGEVHFSSSGDCCAGTAISSNRHAIRSEGGKAPLTVSVRPPLVETDDGFTSRI